MPRTKLMPRGKRPPRKAVINSTAINNAILGSKQNVGPALGAAAAALPGQSNAPRRLGRPRPSGGVGVKTMDRYRKRNRDIKIKKVLPQPRIVNVKKNGVVVRKMTVRRKTYFPGRRKKVY